jgi:NADH-dependent peroxiredoxin subunit C
MTSIGQKIEDFEFEVYQNDEIRKVKFSDYEGKWLVLLFCPADFTFTCLTELEKAVQHYDRFKKDGAEILTVSGDKALAHKAWPDSAPSVKKIVQSRAADPTITNWPDFRTYQEGGLRSSRALIIDPNGILKARSFATKVLLKSNG